VDHEIGDDREAQQQQDAAERGKSEREEGPRGEAPRLR
jgi:hypothetical protein